MTGFPYNWTEGVLTAIVIGLLITTILVVSTILISRWRSSTVEQKKKSLRESLGELVIRYLSGEIEIEQIKKVLRSKIDYITILELINQLDRSLEGPEQQRLRELMEFDEIRTHFLDRFHSSDPVDKAKSCLYFSRLKELDPKLLPELTKLTVAPEPFLCYCSAIAVMAHGNTEQKSTALKQLLKNRTISAMAAADLVIKFTRHGDEYHRNEMAVITGLIRDGELNASRKALLIETLEELGYFHSAPVLLDYYTSLDKATASPRLIQALIRVLARFGAEEILPDIHLHYTSSPHSEVRAAAAHALGFFRKEESLHHLYWLINDPDFQVRYEAASALAGYPEAKLERATCYTLGQMEWQQLKGEVQSQHQGT